VLLAPISMGLGPLRGEVCLPLDGRPSRRACYLAVIGGLVLLSPVDGAGPLSHEVCFRALWRGRGVLSGPPSLAPSLAPS